MAIFTGTGANEIIVPGNVSVSVAVQIGSPFPTGAADQLFGGDGNDTLRGGGGADSQYGGNGNDYVFASNGIDIADGGAGTDTLDTTAWAFDYTVNLTTGLTNWVGESFVNFEHLIAGAGNDSLTGTAGANAITGGDGNDTLRGRGGADSQYGGNGNDYVFASLGIDIADGGAGTDTLDTTSWGFDYAVNLTTGLTDWVGESYVNFERLNAGAGNDTLTGTFGANAITGGDGNDLIIGGQGADTLTGGAGIDRLLGGAGLDRLVGGLGQDLFIFTLASDSSGAGADVIVAGGGAIAFQGAGGAFGDRINLAQIDANVTLGGNQAFTFGFGVGVGTLSLSTVGTDTVVHGNTDFDAAFEFRLVIQDGAVLSTAYTMADFFL